MQYIIRRTDSENRSNKRRAYSQSEEEATEISDVLL